MKTKPIFGKLERIHPREIWRHEALNFTPWLAEAESLNFLAAELGLSELVLVKTEYSVGDFKLDILCSDGEDQVIIENQLGKSDHSHLGQLLTYAAGIGARKVIWIAESFRPEHVAALQFINDNTTEALNFFGVEVELLKIDDSLPARNFKVVVKPNDWTRSSREQIRLALESSPSKQLLYKFWLSLIEQLSVTAPQIRPHKPRPHAWLQTSMGRSGFNLNVIASSREQRLSVVLRITGEDGRDYFKQLLAQKSEIEAGLGFELGWQDQDSPEAMASRLISWYAEASLEDKNRWPEYIDWITNRLIKMDAILRPLVNDLCIDPPNDEKAPSIS
jgi:hypothetical protein